MSIIEENLRNALRMPNIIRPPIQAGPMSAPVQEQPSRLEELYQPQTQATEAFTELLQNIPERNRPGVFRKIAASIAGFGGGTEAADQMLYAPYYNQLEDFQERLGPTQQAAQFEQSANANLRMIANQVLQDERYRRTYDLKVEKEERLVGAQAARELLAEKKLALQTAKQNNPNLKFEVRDDGMIIGLHPQTGQPIETGVKSNELSDLDKINLGLTSALTRIAATGAETRETQRIGEQQRQRNRESLAETRARLGIGVTGEAPSATRTRIVNRANTHIANNPDDAQWIRVISNDVEITAPSRVGFENFGFDTGPDEATYLRLVEAIYGGITNEPQRRGNIVSPERQKAIDWLRTNGITNPNDAQINEAIEDLR